MTIENLEPLFVCNIQIPEKSILGQKEIIHKDFKVLEDILIEFYESLRIVMLGKELFHESKINTRITFNYERLGLHEIQSTIYISKLENINDFESFKMAVSMILQLSIDMIVIERYFSHRKYICHPSATPKLSLTDSNRTLTLEYSHAMIVMLANRLQCPLAKMYAFDKNIYITVNIADDCFCIPGITEALQPKRTHKTDSPEEHLAILHNGNQSEDCFSFLITIGDSKPRKLTKVDVFPLTPIQMKARYKDLVLVEIYHLVKELRGIKSPINDVEFVRLLDAEESQQMMLIPLDDHTYDGSK